MVVLTAAKTFDLSSRQKLVFHLCLIIRKAYNICKGKETLVNPQVTIPAIRTHHDRYTCSTLVYQSEISQQCHLMKKIAHMEQLALAKAPLLNA